MADNAYPVWPGWKTERLIGRGSFGSVYEITRDFWGDIQRCAMKHISVPQDEAELREMKLEGMDGTGITQSLTEQVKDIVGEYRMMMQLKDCPNVVTCYDIESRPKDRGYGWDILIRMELLEPLLDRLEENPELPETEIIHLGLDLCSALVECRKRNIIHRDVKPANIFISANGDYKLGDFGVARVIMEHTLTTRTGTFNYMAPEVYNGKPYDAAADIYSLGMVLYWLVNNRHVTFMTGRTQRERDLALQRRMSGETLPPPPNGSGELKRIILKACAYDPEDRYRNAEEMLRDLKALQAAESIRTFDGEDADNQTVIRGKNPERPAYGIPGGSVPSTAEAPEINESGSDEVTTAKGVLTQSVIEEDADKRTVMRGKKPEGLTQGDTGGPEPSTAETLENHGSESDGPAPPADVPPEPAPKPKAKKWLWFAAALVLCVVIGLLPMDRLPGTSTVHTGDVITFGHYEQGNNTEYGEKKTEGSALTAPKLSVKVGDIIKFGHYRQSAGSYSKDEIEWIVLDVQGDRVLLISRYALDCRPYHVSQTSVTWETCSLRKWLNNDFLNEAFSTKERTQIPKVTVSADRNPNYNTSPGNSTKDQIFLLSINEVNRYFYNDNARKCYPTEYAAWYECYINEYLGTCYWWLRTPARSSSHAVYINSDGTVGYGGGSVSNAQGPVRPALWLNLAS